MVYDKRYFLYGNAALSECPAKTYRATEGASNEDEMKDSVEWNEADVSSLIANEVQESLTLDYKQSDALGKSDGKKNELSKDVSAFANSSGGTILYGMTENGHYPTLIDSGLDPTDISKEWIEQVLNSSVHPKIDGLRINQIPLSSTGTGRVLYAICIPAATSRAPHQAKDKRYYKRYNFESVPMEDYEIRDLYRRASTPDLWIEFSFGTGKTKNLIF
jgi:predicted HTH transcriptional regulator